MAIQGDPEKVRDRHVGVIRDNVASFLATGGVADLRNVMDVAKRF